MAEHKTLAEALAAFQAELPKLTKDETAKVKGETKDGRAYDRSYGYADLAQVVETVLPVLGKHGLSVTSGTTMLGDGFVLEVTLLHESGDGERTAVWPLPDPRRSGPQDIGSSMTYGRRYLTLALTGTYPGGEDDDGAKAQASSRESWDSAQPRTQQAMDQHRRGVNSADEPVPPVKTSWTDDEVSELHRRIEDAATELGNVVNGYDWMASRGLHDRPILIPGTDTDPIKATASEILAYRMSDEAVLPDINLARVAVIRAYAEDRGLLKIQVSETETLDQVLAEAKGRIERSVEKTIDDTMASVKAAGG